MSFDFDRKKFFDGYRQAFGALNQPLVDALNALLDAIEVDVAWVKSDVNLARLAYAFATFKIETAHTFEPIHEYGSQAYFNRRYGPDTPVGKQLGNTQVGDGARFAGRGFVQLTGRRNYTLASEKLEIDFVNNPDLALDPKAAYMIAMLGMTEGWFTDKKFSDYINNEKVNYYHSRKIINGLDRAEEIARMAKQFENILKQASSGDTTPTEIGATNETEVVSPTLTPEPEPVTTTPVEVKKESISWQTKLLTWLGIGTAGGTGVVTAIFDGAQGFSSKQFITIGCILLAGGFIWYLNEAAKRKFQLNKLLIEKASDPNQQTVELSN